MIEPITQSCTKEEVVGSVDVYILMLRYGSSCWQPSGPSCESAKEAQPIGNLLGVTAWRVVKVGALPIMVPDGAV